ncbi:hypothetical protein L2Y96_03640 [Luteibacter aegosomaticola]|jgi:hypothetical protein|uniref:hypothetical protein n=1 Tax=Luteibacter aegosomaticola TaxID=2911538 RepID=UPI001FFA8650|nr:hypothetical protein [Luteibacter aegosomaticola]UPG90880.1 hypothetical protein L2Y96_03640 [Luteibacter aegosomaticola]
MRTFVRSAVAFVAIAMTFAAGNALAVTAHASGVHHAQAFDLPVNCKNPAECSTKGN